MMTLEEAIEQYANTAVFCKMHESEKYAAEFKQLAAWLRELAERRKEPEIVRCGECKHSITYNGVKYVCCEIHNTYPNENYFCCDAERRTDD